MRILAEATMSNKTGIEKGLQADAHSPSIRKYFCNEVAIKAF
jgi:hypothetical protein